MIAYAITARYSESALAPILSHHPDWIAFRTDSQEELRAQAQSFLMHTRLCGAKRFLNGDYRLALELGFDGVHLKSTQFSHIKRAKAEGLYVIVSTHTQAEIAQALDHGADTVTYSPIFPTPNKGQAKGVEALKEAVERFPNRIIALGGILSQREIDAVKMESLVGFSAIRYFEKILH